MISRKKKWPLAVGASLEIVLAVAFGLVVIAAFRGWFSSAAANVVGHKVGAPIDSAPKSARLLGDDFAPRAHH